MDAVTAFPQPNDDVAARQLVASVRVGRVQVGDDEDPQGTERATGPRVAVVVATYNRRPYVLRLLAALREQRMSGPWEVVVVDDGSTDGTVDALQARKGDPFDLVVLSQDRNRGPAAARNRGWRAARAPVVVFTDDDCLPQPGWLDALSSALAEVEIAQGCTQPRRDQRDEWRPFSVTVERLQEDGFYETCNIAYRRDVLERVGGFDESFRYPYGEDSDLAWRARNGGAVTKFVPEALVYHEVWPFQWSQYRRDLRRRDGVVQLVAKHPELRRLFPGRGWYQRRTHPAALLAAGALLATAIRPRSASRLGLAGALLANYGARVWMSRRHPARRWQWVYVMPAALASDLAETAVLARSSLRHRTLLL